MYNDLRFSENGNSKLLQVYYFYFKKLTIEGIAIRISRSL